MKKLYYLLIILLALLFLTGCFNKNIANNSQNEIKSKVLTEEATTTSAQASATTSSQPKAKILSNLTSVEVAKHSIASDCWMIIDSKVYDFTSYIKLGQHPGGDKIFEGCGKEASLMFKLVVKHESSARVLLPNYLLGNLQ